MRRKIENQIVWTAYDRELLASYHIAVPKSTLANLSSRTALAGFALIAASIGVLTICVDWLASNL